MNIFKILFEHLDKTHRIKDSICYYSNENPFKEMTKLFEVDCGIDRTTAIWYVTAWLLFRIGDEYCCIYPDGKQEWYQNGKLHREDGPAVINANGSKMWYLNGEIYREDGPAVINANGDEFTKEEVDAIFENAKEKAFGTIQNEKYEGPENFKENLKVKLDAAIENEEYEEAAKLRDDLNELKDKLD